VDVRSIRWSNNRATIATMINLGVATWLDTTRSPRVPSRRRVFEATLDARLIGVCVKPCTPEKLVDEIRLTLARATKHA